MTAPLHAYSRESVHCAAAKPNRLLETSTAAGWASLLLDHHEGASVSEPFETHATDDLTLVVAIAGRHQLDVCSNGQWRSALYQPGNAGMTPPGETSRLRWHTPSADRPFRTLHLYLPGTLLASVADEYRRIGQPASLTSLSAIAFRDETIAAHASALLAACRGGAPDLYAAGAANWLVTHLLSRQAQWRRTGDDPRRTAAIPDRRLARVIEFMSAQLDSPLTLGELAREAGISVHHFGRRFRERTGLGPSAYLTTLRMERARLLLATTDLQIAEIALRCGYVHAGAFSTAFRRHVGRTPRNYRLTA